MAKRPTIDVTFGPFPLSFPCLIEPDEKYNVYTANAVDDPNSAAMKEAKRIFASALKTFDLDPEEAKLPLVQETQKDPNAPAGAKKPKKIKTGKLVLKSKSQRPPTLFDAAGNEIDPKSINPGGGTIARVQGFIAPYDMNGNEGISFTLTGVQIIKLQERGRRAAFGAYEGGDGYVHNGGTASGGDELQLGSDDEDDQDDTQDDAGGLDI
ncbi:ssDNA-binding protein [Sphingomonas melonis]|uniref:ssDNA-binding protein n=1 Tax=Sphingomonas melonis TaxID=152682 RepID=UPI0035C7EC0D